MSATACSLEGQHILKSVISYAALLGEYYRIIKGARVALRPHLSQLAGPPLGEPIKRKVKKSNRTCQQQHRVHHALPRLMGTWRPEDPFVGTKAVCAPPLSPPLLQHNSYKCLQLPHRKQQLQQLLHPVTQPSRTTIEPRAEPTAAPSNWYAGTPAAPSSPRFTVSAVPRPTPRGLLRLASAARLVSSLLPAPHFPFPTFRGS